MIKKEALIYEQSYPNFTGILSSLEVEKFTLDETNLGLTAMEQTNQHIVITDANGVILYANKAAEIVTGHTKSEMLGNPPRLWGGMMAPRIYEGLWDGLLKGQSFSGELTNRRKNGDIYYAMAHISPLKNKNKMRSETCKQD